MTNISFSQVQKSFHKNKILAIPDFHHLLSSHDKTDHTLSTHFGFLGGINTVRLFYSGLVFPVVRSVNLRQLFDSIIKN